MKRYPACIMATCVVPWDAEYNFAEELFRHQVRTLATTATPHLYVFGTAGEGYAVSDSQFDRIVSVFQEEMKANGAEPIVGIISLSLPTIQERIARWRDRGVRRFQISLPSWGALSERELFAFFDQVCGRFRDCQFLHYNLPRTKRLVTPREYGQLAALHPNLVATKNCIDVIDRIVELLGLSPQLQHFFGETGYAYGSLLGECGLLASTCVTNWKSAQQYFEAGRRRDVEAVIAMQRELSALGRDFLELAGEHIDGAYDKMLWKLHDRRFPLRLQPPYEPATDEAFARFVELLQRKYPRWAGEPKGKVGSNG